MSDEAPDTPVETPTAVVGDTDQVVGMDDTSADDAEPTGREARFRKRMHAAETERDQVVAERDELSARVTAMQRAEIERQAGVRLEKAAGVWAAGATLDDLLTDNVVDADKVKAAVDHATAELGLRRRHELRPDPSQGARGGSGPGGADSWASLFGASQK